MRLIPRLSILCFFVIALSASTATAETQVKWTSAMNDVGGANKQHHPAKTAPKSQRYWDEHNIPRPDYAKTDAEIAAERRGKWGKQQFVWRAGATIFVSILLVQIGAYALVQWRGGVGAGKRLGASSPGTSGSGVVSHLFHHGSSTNPEEEARKARLARFEQQQQRAGGSTNDHNNGKKED